MKTFILPFLLISGLLSFSGPGARAAEPAGASPLAPAFSSGINDVVKLAQSGVEESVVIAYIKSSSVPFQPGADEILKLHELGISSAVITAMLERGGELRRQAPATPPVAYPGYSPSAPAPAAQPATTYAETAAAEPASAEPVSSVVYIGSSYPAYTYPYYSSYGYYPWGYYGYYPYSYWGYYPYRYCGYYPCYRSGYYPCHYSGSGHGFAYHSEPNYYPWYSRKRLLPDCFSSRPARRAPCCRSSQRRLSRRLRRRAPGWRSCRWNHSWPCAPVAPCHRRRPSPPRARVSFASPGADPSTSPPRAAAACRWPARV